MKIVLFGKSGQVGWELQRTLAPMGEGISFGRGPDKPSADFTQPEDLANVVRSIGPRVIVNAAYTSVDMAEDEPALANLVNAEAPRVLARKAAKLGACLVHYSTDFVFDGSGARKVIDRGRSDRGAKRCGTLGRRYTHALNFITPQAA